MTKYYIGYEDGDFGKIYTFDELKDIYDGYFYDYYYDKNFGTNKTGGLASLKMPEYDRIYEFESTYTIEEINAVINHDFYIDTVAILKIMGKLNE